MAKIQLLAAALLVALLGAPAAHAHASQMSDDGDWVIITGHTKEPITTCVRTGFDFIIRATDANPGGDAEELRVHETVTATIYAPDGTDLDCDLHVQHGATNRYSCADPYILTQPGQYEVQLDGHVQGSDITGRYNISGPVQAYETATFPDRLTPPGELEARIEALEAKLAQYEAALGGTPTGGDAAAAPGVGPVAVGLLALAAVAMARRKDRAD